MRRRPVAAVLVAAVWIAGGAACGGPATGKAPNATEAECEQYRNKLFSLLPEAEREAAGRMGLQKATKFELALCMERITSDEVACALTKTTQADALACKPTTDIRPPEAQRTEAECNAYREHVTKLGALTQTAETAGPPFTPAMAAMLARECERWMSKSRYDCIMKAGSPLSLMSCRP
jgi:hypothetical protein